MNNSNSSFLAVLIALIGLVGVILTGVIAYSSGQLASTNRIIDATATAEMRRTAQPTEANVASAGKPTDTPASSACAVPDLASLDQSAAEKLVTQLGLQPVRSLQYNADFLIGTVFAQEPTAGTILDSCRGKVTIVISQGPIPPPATATKAIRTAVMNVQATQSWQTSGVYVHTGNEVEITYKSGQWSAGPPDYPYVGPEGNIGAYNTFNPGIVGQFILPGAEIMELVCKVGNGSPVAVGQHAVFTTDAEGEIFCTSNDDKWSDNRGSVSIEIAVSE